MPWARSQSAWDAVGCAAAGSWSTATSQVMSCVPRSSSGGPPRAWPRYVRTHSVHGRRGQLVGGRRVVEGEHPSARPGQVDGVAHPVPRPASCAGCARRPAASTRGPADVGTRTSTSCVAVQRRRAPRPSPSSCARAARRAGCRAARWRARRTDPAGAAGRRGSPTIGPGRRRRPGVGSSSVVRRSAGEGGGRVLEGAGARRAGVAALPTARRARSAARGLHAGLGRQHRPSQRARTGARLDHGRHLGPARLGPPGVQRARHHGAEERRRPRGW